jgi:hypothetical protein
MKCRREQKVAPADRKADRRLGPRRKHQQLNCNGGP